MNFRRDETGAFLLLVALLAVPLIAVIGLAIDGFIVILTLTTCTDVARLAALGAGRVMADGGAAGEPEKSEKIETLLKEASVRANTIVKLNADAIPGKVFYSTGFKPEVSVSLGQWYPETKTPLADEPPAPCGSRPCFMPIKAAGEPFDTVRVRVNPPELKTIFIRIVGPKAIDFSVEAFAIIDLSSPGSTNGVRLIE